MFSTKHTENSTWILASLYLSQGIVVSSRKVFKLSNKLVVRHVEGPSILLILLNSVWVANTDIYKNNAASCIAQLLRTSGELKHKTT
jgi:hypothetical protein